MLSKETLLAYQPVIGLEVHVQLQTNTKVFAPEGFKFGAEPNFYISPVTIAHPGALPYLNSQCVDHAIKLGLAINAEITPVTYFDRKNYFYPDLPKGYQISQDNEPIVKGGYLDIQVGKEEKKHIRIERIHIEEDAGKSIHDLDDSSSMIDLNRAGTGLLEIVTHPDFRNAEEASVFVSEIRKIVRYLEVSDADMEKGNLRCDANVSVMKAGASKFGTRVEVKNLNSISNLAKAINHEIERQINFIEDGGKIVRETRTWDPNKSKTSPMRDKETADDYRYFPEPDLLPVKISQEKLLEISRQIPSLPQERLDIYTKEWKIPKNEALVLVETRDIADYFESLVKDSGDAKASAAWILGPIKEYLNENQQKIIDFPLNTKQIAEIIRLISEEKINFSSAKGQLFPALIKNNTESVYSLAQSMNLMMESDASGLASFMDKLMDEYPDEVDRYRKGKKGLIGFFVGNIMKEFKGKANPKEVNKVVKEKLEA